MNRDTKRLLDEALRVPESERFRLAEHLLATFDGEPDPDAAEAWEVAIARRSRGMEEGLVDPVLWSAVKRAARKGRGES